MQYYIKALQNFSNFSGRARRKEYWMFILFNLIFTVIATVLDNILNTTVSMEGPMGEIILPYGYIYFAYVLFILIPSLAIVVRRLHDVGKSGWFFLIVLIPLIGAIWLLVLLLTDSQPGENKWGANPKGIHLNY